MSQHSSPARERYKAERQARRHAAAAAMRSVHAATIGKPKVTGATVQAELLGEAVESLREIGVA